MFTKLVFGCAILVTTGVVVYERPQNIRPVNKGEANCISRGQSINDSPFISYVCFETDQGRKSGWKHNIEFLTDIFQAVSEPQCEYLMKAAERYEFTGTAADRLKLLHDLQLISDALRLAADTAHLANTYTPEHSAKMQQLERNFLWVSLFIDGPISWNFPTDREGIHEWSLVLRLTIRLIRYSFEDLYHLTENTLDECNIGDNSVFVLSIR